MTGGGCRLRRVVDVKQKLDLFGSIRQEMSIERFHGDAAEDISDGGHSVSQAA